MRYCYPIVISLLLCLSSFSQTSIKGIIADSTTRQALPFATIRLEGQFKAVITGMNGHFSISVPAGTSTITVSYVNYRERSIHINSLKSGDTLFLAPTESVLGEVVIHSKDDKIRRIINTAIRNKPLHHPEMYQWYQCNVYYKMKGDLLPVKMQALDSARFRRQARALKDSGTKKQNKDTVARFNLLSDNNHVLFSETFSRRLYKRPQQLQEIIIASRFSGLKKTYFGNRVTDVLPFHVYGDYIMLNGVDYVNPIAKGWQQRYDFRLYDEIRYDNDTTFILAFAPKEKAIFNSLHGLVYINSDGYAISHFIGNTGDSTDQRDIRVEQIYQRWEGKWFPRELNYELSFKKYPSPFLTLRMDGHSIIDSVSFAPLKKRIDKAYSVKLSDSVDLYTEEQWKAFRMDTITVRELNTYRIMDSLFKKARVEKIINGVGQLAVGRLPIGKADIDINRIIASNDYEGTRLGIGLYTNDKVSRYFSLGGWLGYGTKDKVMKYGGSLTVFPRANKDNWLRASYDYSYQNAGNIYIHNEIDRSGFRNWLLTQVDKVEEYALTAHTQKGYWEIELKGSRQKLTTLYGSNFMYGGNNILHFNKTEAGIGLRYAYGEKRVPFFGYYFPSGTKYPIVYLRSVIGSIDSGDYSNRYIRALAAVTYSARLNRWGKDNFHLEAGFARSFNNRPFPRSFLMAAKGFRSDGLNFYAWGGFITMRPYDFYSDAYVSFLYKHDLEKYFWRLKFSKPFASLAHNMVYGRVDIASKTANTGTVAPSNGYHETGVVLNQLLQMNFVNAAYLYLNVGAFYHWTPVFDWQRNGVFVVGLSMGF
jgi:hypothetical protein